MKESRDESLDLLIELAGPSATDVVLDYAAGAGMAAFTLAPEVDTLEAAADRPDMLEEGLRLASELGLENMAFTLVDLFSLPHPDDTFSLAMGCDVLHLSANPVAALAELRRVTRDGGRVVIVDAVVDEAVDDAFNDLARLRQPAHRRHYRPEELESLAGEAGLRASRRGSVRCTVDLDYWLQTAGAPASKAALVRERFKALPVAAQIGMDVAFSDRAISFSYDVCGLRLERD